MRQKAVDFRELLERLLPLGELPWDDHLRVTRALRTGITAELEQAAMLTLSRLEQTGAVRRVPAAGNGGPVLRYQARDTLELFTLHLPGGREREGLVLVPHARLPAQAQTSLEQVRRLLRLDEALLSSDPRSGRALHGLLEHLDQAGRALLGASEVRFHAIPENGVVGEPLSAELVVEVRRHPEVLIYCPDTERSARLQATGRRRRIRSAVLAAVTSSTGQPLGHLEVLAREPDRFRPDDLALVVLLADTCAGTIERAARIEKLVFIDPLTSIYNRSYFDLQVRNEMARAGRERHSMALCIADIDDFKSFNTAFGYEAGNRVLVQVAQALRRGVRPFDTVARWGGEEFAILLTPPIHAQDVMAISERLRGLVERLAVEVQGLDRRAHRVGVTVSLGVALFPDHGQDAEELWRAANRALLEAKRPPKNQVVFYAAEARPA